MRIIEDVTSVSFDIYQTLAIAVIATSLGIFLILDVALVILQNMVAVGSAMIFGMDKLLGLCTGSIPMTGGHGTSAAFGPYIRLFDPRISDGCSSRYRIGIFNAFVRNGDDVPDVYRVNDMRSCYQKFR